MTVQKWGNSLAIRIPKPLAERVHLDIGEARVGGWLLRACIEPGLVGSQEWNGHRVRRNESRQERTVRSAGAARPAAAEAGCRRGGERCLGGWSDANIDYREQEVGFVASGRRDLVEEVRDKLLPVMEEE